MQLTRDEFLELLKALSQTPGIVGYADWLLILRHIGIPPERLALEGKNHEVVAEMILSYLQRTQSDTLYRRLLSILLTRYSPPDTSDEVPSNTVVFLKRLLTQILVGNIDENIPPIRETDLIKEAMSPGNAPSYLIAILDQAKQASRAVAFIHNLYQNVVGTGILITPSLLLTCRHILPTTNDAAQADFVFNYQFSANDLPEASMVYRRKAGGIFHVSNHTHLDYALVELAPGKNGVLPGKTWSSAKITTNEPVKGAPIFLVHHMFGEEKRIAFSKVASYREPTLGYLVDTMPGSSGGAIFDTQLQLMGLHEGSFPESFQGHQFSQNQGLAVRTILADIPEQIHNLIKAQA